MSRYSEQILIYITNAHSNQFDNIPLTTKTTDVTQNDKDIHTTMLSFQEKGPRITIILFKKYFSPRGVQLNNVY